MVQEVRATSALLPEDEALLMTAAAITTYDEITTGSIAPKAAPALTAEFEYLLLEPWAQSLAEYEARLTP